MSEIYQDKLIYNTIIVLGVDVFIAHMCRNTVQNCFISKHAISSFLLNTVWLHGTSNKTSAVDV